MSYFDKLSAEEHREYQDHLDRDELRQLRGELAEMEEGEDMGEDDPAPAPDDFDLTDEEVQRMLDEEAAAAADDSEGDGYNTTGHFEEQIDEYPW